MTDAATESKTKEKFAEKAREDAKKEANKGELYPISKSLFERAQAVIPGGVNSPVRACKAVGTHPVFMRKADGCHMYDVDHNEYVDFVGSWGALILGHRHPRVLEAIEDLLHTSSTSYGAPCHHEVELAELLCKRMPSIEMVRMVNSGTEACMSAVRLARAYTKKDMIIKFDGCYHGHADGFLVKAGSGLATLGIPSSPGVPEALSKLTVSLPFNDLAAVKEAFQEHKGDIAAVIVETIVGNAGLILPAEGYLQGLRELCDKHNALLIFDEVMTGFRVHPGGAQKKYDVTPDLTCLGKIIGAGLPVGAYGGKKEIMELVAPQGEVYQAGTLSGNPLAMAAGIAQLKAVQNPHTYTTLEENTKTLAEGIESAIEETGVAAKVVYICGMITVFFSKDDVTDLESAKKCDTDKFAKVWKSLLKNGVYWPPSQFEAAFVSLVHTKRDIEHTVEKFKEALEEIK